MKNWPYRNISEVYLMENQTNILKQHRTITRRTREEINNLIAKWETSKLSQSEFCRRKVLCVQHFVVNRKANQKQKLYCHLYQ